MARGTYYFFDQKEREKTRRLKKYPEGSARPYHSSRPSSRSSFARPKTGRSVDLQTSEDTKQSLGEIQSRKKSISGIKLFSLERDKVLQAIEEEETVDPVITRYFSNFNEARFAATGILQNLVKLSAWSELSSGISDLTIPQELSAELKLDFEDLTEDTQYNSREWQTDCYLDLTVSNKNPFFEERPEGETEYQKGNKSLKSFLAEQKKKKVKMAADEGKKTILNASKEGPGSSTKRDPRATPRSRHSSGGRPASSMSINSDLFSEFLESTDERDEGYDYLPPGFGVQGPSTPSVLKYPAESLIPNYEHMKNPTRLEKHLKQKMNSSKKKVKVKRKSVVQENQEEEPATTTAVKPATAHINRGGQDVDRITFSMSNKDCEKCGWFVTPDDKQDPEGVTLLKWIQARLQEAIKQRNEANFAAKLRGEDGPLIHKFYGDHRSHHFHPKAPQSWITIPLPPGVKPGVTAVRLSIPSLEKGPPDERRKFLTLLPDGSGTLYYPSGRPAVVLSRRGDGAKGLYVFVYSDADNQAMLAYFRPNGCMCCYHPNGKLHLLTDKHGGKMFDQAGDTSRQWTWPAPHYKLPVSVVVQFSSTISFRCKSLSNAFVYFVSGNVSHKISVSPVLDTVSSQESDELKTSASFSSSTAQSMIPLEKKTNKGLKISKKPQTSLQKEEQQEDGDSSLLTEDQVNIELRNAKSRVKLIVNEWMGFYRQHLGISRKSPSPSLLSSTSRPAMSPSLHYPPPTTVSRPQSHSRHLTHPLSTSRPHSQFSHTQSAVLHPSTPPTEESNFRIVYQRPNSSSQSSHLRSHTVPNHFMGSSTAHNYHDQVRKKQRAGCPVALRTKLVHRLVAIPACKCDKRRLPRITDVEYDMYLRSHVPRDQVVVVLVDDSRQKDKDSILIQSLTSIHAKLNRDKHSPCEMSTQDPYRFLLYDISTASQNTKQSTPLLVSRHNIGAVTVLMYCNAKLIFAGTRFDGYGTSVKDFYKEVANLQLRIKKYDHRLPYDFKLAQALSKKNGTEGGLNGSIEHLELTLSDLTLDPTSESGLLDTSSASLLNSKRKYTSQSQVKSETNVLTREV